MKLKLTGLLLLSQAAAALTIDKTNYKQHLCDEGLLKRGPAVVYETPPPAYLEQANENNIKGDFSYYCAMRSYYDEAVEKRRTGSWRTQMACAGNQKDFIEAERCMEKQGIFYAQACEKLKQDRDAMPNPWNAFVSHTVSCNNM